ncbi:MAG: sugar phosphate isomerase/epimerase family protein [Anaerolineae bacterium]
MQPCINQATTMTTDFATDMRAYAEAGFESVELWLPKLQQFLDAGSTLEAAESLLRQLGLKAVAACAQGDMLASTGPVRLQALAQLRRFLGMSRALGAETLVVYSESPQKVDESVYEQAVANLAEACDIAAEFGVTIALEFIKGSSLVGSLTTAQWLIERAKRPNLGLLLDTFHFYAGISKMEDLRALDATTLALVHINDAKARQREIWTDADRVLLGEGVLPLREMMTIIKSKGYEGYCSLELFNKSLWDADPFAVARCAHTSLTGFLANLP